MVAQKDASIGSPSSQSGASEGDQKATKRTLVGEKYTTGRKLKSAADSKSVKGVNVQKGVEWKQPLRRHINPETNTLEFVTILVRVLSGDAEHDFHARFPPTPLYAKNVCAAIAEREHLQSEEATIFTLWVISKDLEMQIRPDQDIFELMVFWNRWVMKYTHFPEAEDPRHHVNRHWFIYRREANISLRLERELAGEVAVSLLFGEAKRNILTKRYVCSQLESATIAGYQLQMAYGDYLIERSPPGYLIKDNRLNQLLPVGMVEKMRPSQWEEIITVQYKSFLGLNPLECRQGFLEFVRHMPCYGSSFFPVCGELPPSGFFEFRTQNWFLGTGPNGLCIIDSDVQKYVYNFNWKDITFKSGPDQFFIYHQRGERVKEIKLITPQGKVIDNLALRHKYSWAKENGKLKSKNLTKDPEILESNSIIASILGRKKSIASVKRKGEEAEYKSNQTMRSSTVSAYNQSKNAMRANSVNKRRESKASFKSDNAQQEIPDDGQSKTACNPPQSQNQTAKKEVLLTVFIEEEEEEEEKPEKNDKKKFQESSLSKMNIAEVIKASSDHLAESFENLGKIVSKSVSRLIHSSEEQIPQNVEKVKISAEDMNSLFKTEVVHRKAPIVKENLKELVEVKVISEPTENVAILVPPTTSALIKERKNNRRPIPLTKRHGNSFNNSSNTSLEVDLLSQLDSIASSVGVVVQKADISSPSKSKIGSPLNPLSSPTSSELSLQMEQQTNNIQSSSTNDTDMNEKNSVKNKSANELQLEIKDQNHVSRISKTALVLKNDIVIADATQEPEQGRASPLSSKKQRPVTSYQKMSPSSSRPSYPSAKKVSRFGKANDFVENAETPTKKVGNPSSKLSERLEDSITSLKLTLPENVEIEALPDAPSLEEPTREESNAAPTNIPPTSRRHSRLPTGRLGTHIDVVKVKQQRLSKMMPSKSGIVKRSDDVFSLDAIIGGVGKTELIDKRA